jgi:hypothetical protein
VPFWSLSRTDDYFFAGAVVAGAAGAGAGAAFSGAFAFAGSAFFSGALGAGLSFAGAAFFSAAGAPFAGAAFSFAGAGAASLAGATVVAGAAGAAFCSAAMTRPTNATNVSKLTIRTTFFILCYLLFLKVALLISKRDAIILFNKIFHNALILFNILLKNQKPNLRVCCSKPHKFNAIFRCRTTI